MAEEVRCQRVLEFLGGYGNILEETCSAPIPRLDEGPCANCKHDKALHDEGEAWCDACWQFPRMGAELCAYVGPLASECEKGHPQ